VIYPYHVEEVEENDRKAVLYSAEELQETLPLSWDYFQQHETDLRARERGGWENSERWWEFGRSQNLEKFETPKTIQAEIADEATFMLDSSGTWCFTTAYGVTFNPNLRDLTKVLSAELNSKALDFYIKHIATIKAGGYYSYRTQYVEKLPCITQDNGGGFSDIREAADKIVDTIDLDSRTDRFPEAYLGDYDGELDYITYEWQTRRYPVNADIQGDVDGDFTVQAGRSDEINDPAMYSDDRDARKRRAEYVHAAVDGRSVKSGEETTIPIPRSDDGVVELLERLEADHAEVKETEIAELEAEIDDAVYDLFDLSAEERAVVEDYLEVF
jgi:hypothetical protein